ncbi:hypothetical protein ACFOMD_10640 [Sphingoaurantiacus capsulatus]|uniref:Uncharacterized protein n=1 Tax=Sphingoaurantiacus capsulatus TaxID=1771310 RepID=A0ABV7XCR5_9SPHN
MRDEPPPPHPLAGIEAADIVAVTRLTAEGPQVVAGAELTRAAAVIAALKTATPIRGDTVAWGSATLLRATTKDGVLLSLQAKPITGGGAVRVTADPDGDGDPATGGAKAIRNLRLAAYRVAPEALAVLRPAPEPISDIDLNAEYIRQGKR